VELAPAQARHLRDVLRLRAGDSVEAFDDAGRTASAKVEAVTPENVTLSVGDIAPARREEFAWTIAAAVPKGARADWMIEKLAELGTAVFVPLATERSVTHPEGKEKPARWTRLATEAARQSGGARVMRIEGLTPVRKFVEGGGVIWYLTLEADAPSIKRRLDDEVPAEVKILIGPEGGWTEREIEMFRGCDVKPARLGRNILRVETAAVAAGAIMGAFAF